MSAPLKSEELRASELAREVSSLPGHALLTFLGELSSKLTERSVSGKQEEHEIIAALAEHFGDAEECAHLSALTERG